VFEEAMHQQSCTLVGNELWQACNVETLESGAKRFSNGFTTDAMPDPVATLEIVEIQPNLKEMILSYQVAIPITPTIAHRHAMDVFPPRLFRYEEECRFLNRRARLTNCRRRGDDGRHRHRRHVAGTMTHANQDCHWNIAFMLTM
jgi:hypothetical protein